MPPRHVYWTIILEGKPTAFRAATQEETAGRFEGRIHHPVTEMLDFPA